MDKKSFGRILLDMKEQDEVHFVDKKTRKIYRPMACQYKYDRIKEKQIVTFFMTEIE